VVRRGDALGLRAFADQLADAVAPGMSNRVNDDRWVTILAWCLTRSHEVFHATHARSAVTRREQQQRYAWLRPLELMWVARTIALADQWRDRPLSGQRRVRPWLEVDERQSDRFGMSVDQFRAYRQTGMYGGYRIAFRKWAGMTVGGDGWTPAGGTLALARWLDDRLGPARPWWTSHEAHERENGHPLCRAPKLGQGEEHKWWLRHWTEFLRHSRRGENELTFPRPRNESQALAESRLLESVAFARDPDGKRRRAVAQASARAKARDHAAVCEHLSQVFEDHPSFVALPFFTRLADAGIGAMNVVAEELHGRRDVALAPVAAMPRARDAVERLSEEADAWRRAPSVDVPHVHTVGRFAEAILDRPRAERLGALLEYHERYGGGLRWFVVRNGRVEPRVTPRSGSTRYRFRLWALCRIAVQAGLLSQVPEAIRDDASAGDEQEDSDD